MILLRVEKDTVLYDIIIDLQAIIPNNTRYTDIILLKKKEISLRNRILSNRLNYNNSFV